MPMMNIVPMPNEDEPKSWKVYSTPTKPTAKVLKELVAHQDPSNDSPPSSTSSHSSSSRSSRTTNKGKHSPQPPLPLLPEHHQEQAKTKGFAPMDVRTTLRDSLDDYAHHVPTHHKRKHTSTGLPRRVFEELNGHDHRHNVSSTESTPTNSHEDRHRYPSSRSHSHLHSHSHSHTRDSMSVLIMLSRERLARETARATEAERRAADAERQVVEVMALFRTTHEAKAKLEMELHRTREELGLYKVQLDVAQKEIFRAQEVVDRVDRQRVSAEDEASRTKTKLRSLTQTVAVERALDEGRRAGFEEGLRQGRLYQQTVPWDDIYDKAPKKKHRQADDASEVSTYTYPKEGSSEGSSSSKSKDGHRTHKSKPTTEPATSRRQRASTTTKSINPQVSTYDPHPRAPNPPAADRPSTQPAAHATDTNAHPHGTPPGVAAYAQPLPIRTVITPIPVPVPQTQLPVPPAVPPHHAPEAIKVRPSSSDDHAHQSTQAQKQTQDGFPWHQRSQTTNAPPVPYKGGPVVGHGPITLPPDNYIPVMRLDSVIALPAPHELSQPVCATSEAAARPAVKDYRAASAAAVARGTGGGDGRFRVTNAPRAHVKDREDGQSVRTAFTVRTAHTTQSVRDLEREAEREREREREQDKEKEREREMERDREGARERERYPAVSTHVSEKDIVSPPRGRDVYRRMEPQNEPQPHVPWNEGREAQNQTERAPADLAPYTRPPSTAPPQPQALVRTPRRAREVSLPIPLGDPFDDPTTAHENNMRGLRSTTPNAPAYGRPTTPANRPTTPSNAVYGRPVTPGNGIYTRPHAPTAIASAAYTRQQPRRDPSADAGSSRDRTSAATIEIDVETPTTTHQSMPSNRNTIVDPVLLTPESANRPLPDFDVHQNQHSHAPADTIELHIPDNNNLQAGFVPLSPIPGMESLHAYPPGFAPSLPRDHPAASGDFRCSSPLVRPVA